MWRNYRGHPLGEDLSSAVKDAVESLRKEGFEVRVCIGTDSQVRGPKVTFATVIVFLAVGNGGFMFVNKRKLREKLGLRERMMREITYSIETAYSLHELFESMNIPVEIHADINRDPRFPSHQSYQEAMGYIRSMGYHFVSKPDAFASSICADRFCD
jgi:uncharacterized protein